MRFAPALCTIALGSLAVAQCNPIWLPTDNPVGTNGTVLAATRWDPDGAGPLPARLVLGGTFSSAVGTPVANVVQFATDTGQPFALGSGCAGPVHALTTLGTGELVAGGAFALAGTTTVGGLARWDGSAWQPFGGSFANAPTESVQALASMPNGDLVVGGSFQAAHGTPAANLARWNGTAWQALGSGVNGAVTALAVLANGDVIAGGSFTQAGGVAANRIARWNGTQWSALGAGLDASVLSVAVAGNGDLLVGGAFTQAGGAPANAIARWDGTAWHTFGSGCNATVRTVLVETNGDVIAGGAFTQAGGIPCARIARQHAGAWQPFGNGFAADVRTLVPIDAGDTAAAGDFVASGAVALARLARLHASSIRLLAGHTGLANVNAAGALPDGRLVALVANQHVQRWDDPTWTTLGSTASAVTQCLAVSTSGRIAIGGFGGVAIWTNGVWQSAPLANVTVYGLAWANDGTLVAATDSANGPVQRWNGATWSTVGTAFTQSGARKIAVRANGNVVVAGYGLTPTVYLAESQGGAWQFTNLPSIASGVGWTDLVALPDGTVACAGPDFAQFGQVAMRWNGTSLTPIGSTNGTCSSLALLPDGRLLAGGTMTTSWWNGSSWVPLTSENGHRWLVPLPSGEVASMLPMQRFVSECFASARPLATDCLGPAGPITLTAPTAPWLGTTFAASANGFAPGALALSLFGFTALDLPIASAMPQGLPNCNLLASLDSLTPTITFGGSVASQLGIPNAVALRGMRLFHQFVQLELGGVSGIQSVSASNGLALTIGGY